MKKHLLRFAAAFAAVLTITGGTAVPAQAHVATQYLGASVWPYNTSVRFAVNSGWPGSDYALRMVNAKDQWAQHDTGAEPSAAWTLPDYQNYGVWQNPCTLSSGNNTGILFWADLESLGSTVVAATQSCHNSGTRTRVTITLDYNTAWYTGTGDAPPGTTDAYAVGSHEWGHAFGYSAHFPEFTSGICPVGENVQRHTMCPQIFSGYEVQRHPKTHDIHTFQARY